MHCGTDCTGDLALRRHQPRRLVHASETLGPRRDLPRRPARDTARRLAESNRVASDQVCVRAGKSRNDQRRVRLPFLLFASCPARLILVGHADREPCREPLKAHLLQVAILSNHMNGKDTHVRGIRVFAPRT